MHPRDCLFILFFLDVEHNKMFDPSLFGCGHQDRVEAGSMAYTAMFSLLEPHSDRFGIPKALILAEKTCTF